jgi:hypothetical protein
MVTVDLREKLRFTLNSKLMIKTNNKLISYIMFQLFGLFNFKRILYIQASMVVLIDGLLTLVRVLILKKPMIVDYLIMHIF